MQTQIHPTWYPEAKITCACGATYTYGATSPEIHVEVCASCHPFYTGQMKFLDTAGRVDAFRAKVKGAQSKVLSKTERRAEKRAKKLEEELSRPDTLAEFKKEIKKSKKKAKKS